MRVTNMLPDVQYQMQQSQQALATATQQLSTGLRVNQPSDDPSAYSNMVISLAESASVDSYTSNISSALPQMQMADSAISSMGTSLNTAVTLGTQGATGTNSAANTQALASQVEGLLTGVIAQANTSFQGVYIFGGTETTTPPFVAASTTYNSSNGTAAVPLASTAALTNGSVTTVTDATTGDTFSFKATGGDNVASIITAISNAVSAGTLPAGITVGINATTGQLSIASNNPAEGIVVTSNDPALGSMNAAAGTAVPNAYAYVGNGNTNSVQIGESMSVPTNLPGNQLLVSGANVIGSLNQLITALQSGTTAQIGAATTSVSTALNYVSQQRVPLDNTISQLNAQDSTLSQETLNLTTQQTALVGISTADAATNLSQATLENSAVLGAAAKVLPETLLQYLQ
ncbi:MAG: flagellar hook-associated protein FlgL [Terracidiphilus sp.]|jgi:flagellar hook-associated protein 3 FlgL